MKLPLFILIFFSLCSANTLTDLRDGKKYRTVKIFTQTWMAENLNYAASGSKCYDNKPENCAKYGRLYDWSTATALPSNCNEDFCSNRIRPKHRGVCPEGWHIPSYDEWDLLMAAVGGEETAGKHLKATSGWKYNGTDDFGFSALPGGRVLSVLLDGSFDSIGLIGYWWSTYESAREDYSDFAYYRSIYDGLELAYWGSIHKSSYFSVRCVKD